MRKFTRLPILFALCLLAFGGAALIPVQPALAEGPPVPADPTAFLEQLVGAFMAHQWPVAVGLAMLAIAVVLWKLGSAVTFLETPKAHALVLFACAALPVSGGVLSTGAFHATVQGIVSCAAIGIFAGFAAVGGWQMFAHMFLPKLVKDPNAAPAKLAIPKGPGAAMVLALVGLALGAQGCTASQIANWKAIGVGIGKDCVPSAAEQAIADAVDYSGLPGATPQSVAAAVAEKDGAIAAACAGAELISRLSGFAALSPRGIILRGAAELMAGTRSAATMESPAAVHPVTHPMFSRAAGMSSTGIPCPDERAEVERLLYDLRSMATDKLVVDPVAVARGNLVRRCGEGRAAVIAAAARAAIPGAGQPIAGHLERLSPAPVRP